MARQQAWVHDTRASLLDVYYRGLGDAHELLPVVENDLE
jgi:hypothetical protein